MEKLTTVKQQPFWCRPDSKGPMLETANSLELISTPCKRNLHHCVLKEVPVLYRFKVPGPNVSKDRTPVPEPTDAEFLRIKEMESRTIDLASIQKRHKMVITSEKCLSGALATPDQILEPRGSGTCLAIRVSAGTLDRALNIMNAIIVTPESEGFPVSVDEGAHRTSATIFGARSQLRNL